MDFSVRLGAFLVPVPLNISIYNCKQYNMRNNSRVHMGYRLSRGVMGWAVRACTQTLATPDNLQRWGVRVDPKCGLEGCEQICTLGHLLSCCTYSLDRYKFRHDSCLTYILEKLTKHSPNLPYYKRVGSPAAALLISWSS